MNGIFSSHEYPGYLCSKVYVHYVRWHMYMGVFLNYNSFLDYLRFTEKLSSDYTAIKIK